MNLFPPLYIIAIVCQIGTNTCREIVADEQARTPAECLAKAVVLGTNWVKRHPGWEFLTGRCDVET